MNFKNTFRTKPGAAKERNLKSWMTNSQTNVIGRRSSNRARALSLLLTFFLLTAGSTAALPQDFWVQTSGPAGGVVRELTRDASGVLWASVNNQLFLSTNNGLEWRRLESEAAFGAIRSITALNSGDILIGVRSGFWRITNHSSLSFLAVAVGVGFSSANETPSGALLAGGRFGGIWRSPDDGVTWTEVLSQRRASWTITAIKTASGGDLFAASDLAGSTRGGIFKSTNDGVTWSHSDSALTNTGVTSLACDSKGHIYAGTGSGFEGVSVTHDGGRTWETMNAGLSNTLVNVIALSDSGIVYAGTRAGIFLSENYGDTWKNAGEEMNGRSILSLTPGDGSAMLAGTNIGVHLNPNPGAPWTSANNGMIASRVTDMTITSGLDALASADGLHQTRDRGDTWKIILSDVSVNDVATKGDSTIFVASNQGMFRSLDGGASWLPINSGLTTTRLEAVDISPDGQTLIAGSDIDQAAASQLGPGQLDYLFRSEDNGDAWQPIDHGFIINSVHKIIFKNDSLVFLLPFESEMFRSSDRGRKWQRLPREFPSRILDIAFNSDGDLYAVTAEGSLVSEDDGATWTELLDGESDLGAESIAINSQNDIFVVTNTGGVDVSRNNGALWESVTGGLAGQTVETIAIDPLGLLYAGTSSSGVFRSSQSTAPVAILIFSADTLDFGLTPVGGDAAGSLLFGNAGNATLIITQSRIAGPDSANFAIVGGGRFPGILPDASVLRLFNLQSAEPGELLAFLILESNSTSSPDTVVFKGFGANKLLSSSHAAVDFGVLRLGADSTQTFYLKNTGNAFIQIDSATNSRSQFLVSRNLQLPAMIDAGDSLAISVTFVPDTVEATVDTLRFRNDSHNAGPELVISLSGAGGVGLLTVEPASRNFGDIAIGDHTDATFALRNPGQIPVIISDLELGENGFTLVNPRATPFAIDADSAATVSVRFNPDSNRVFVDVLKIHNDSHNERPLATAPLTGTGQLQDLDVRPGSLDFGQVTVGLRLKLPVTIHNQAPFDIEIDSASIAGPDSIGFGIQTGGRHVVIASGGTHVILIEFSPVSAGTKKATLEISCPNPAKDPVDIPLQGEALDFQPTLPPEISVGQNLVLTVPQPADFQAARRQLFFRMGGQFNFSSIELEADATTFSGRVPPEFVTLRGLEYYVSLSDDSARSLTFPASTPDTSPATVQVAAPQIDSPQEFEPTVYRMISVPASLTAPAIDSVLFDDFGAYDPDLWRFLLWRETADAQAYVELPAMDASFTFAAGRAYWVTTRFGTGFDIDDAISTKTNKAFEIKLGPGWNQIGNPFAFPVAWSEVVKPERVGMPRFYIGAVESNPDSLFSDATVLLPWEGYFLYNDSRDSVSIFVPPNEHDGSEPENDSPPAAAAGYTLKLSVESISGLRDKNNYLGLHAGVGEDADWLDRFEPPPIGNFVSLSIVESGREFNANFKPIAGDGQAWDLQLSSSNPNDEVEIILLETGVLPAGFVRHVLDMEDETVARLQDNMFRVRLGQAFSPRRLRVLLGTADFNETHSAGVSLIPVQFTLGQNYPNPFNPETNIEYQVDRRGPVSLDVYNLLGQNVRTLVKAVQSPGAHTAIWDGKNDNGESVASGVYVYRLRAGRKTATRKLALIK